MGRGRHGWGRRLLLALTTVVTVSAVSAGLSGAAVTRAGAAPAAKPVTGGTWTVGINTEVPTLDPVRGIIGSLTQGGDRAFLVFGTLMIFNNKTGQVMPGLAESITSTDAQTWTLKLRPNVKFSDGTPLDADAVIFNFQRFMDPANAFTGIASVSQITKMTAVNPTTIEFKLAEPNGSFAMVFTDTVGNMGSPAAIKANPTNWGQKPVGAGPFLLKEWIRDREYTFVRNPTYFDKPKPYIDTIVMKVIPDPNTLASALQSGEIDAIHGANQLVQLKVAVDDPKTFRGPDPSKLPGALGVGCNLERPPCNDIRFREAVALSFDFSLVKQVFLDPSYPRDTLQCAPFGPDNPFCAKDVKVKYNPTRAKKLIDEMKAEGLSTDITYTFNPTGVGASHGEFVQQQLAKVGIKVTLATVASNNAYIDVQNRHAFHAGVINSPAAADPTIRYYNDWHSVGGFKGGRDIANFNNAQLDVALEKGRNSLKLADQIAGFQEAQRLIQKQFLIAWFVPRGTGVVSRKTLQLAPYQTSDVVVYRYDEAWLKQAKK